MRFKNCPILVGLVVVEAVFALKHWRSHQVVAEVKWWLQTPETQHPNPLHMFCKTTCACCPTSGKQCLYLFWNQQLTWPGLHCENWDQQQPSIALMLCSVLCRENLSLRWTLSCTGYQDGSCVELRSHGEGWSNFSPRISSSVWYASEEQERETLMLASHHASCPVSPSAPDGGQRGGLGRTVCVEIIRVHGKVSWGWGLRPNHWIPAWPQFSEAFSKVPAAAGQCMWAPAGASWVWDSSSNMQLNSYQRVMMFSHYQLGLDFNWWPRGESLYTVVPAIARHFSPGILFAVVRMPWKREIQVGWFWGEKRYFCSLAIFQYLRSNRESLVQSQVLLRWNQNTL